jgi:hypothetical protein
MLSSFWFMQKNNANKEETRPKISSASAIFFVAFAVSVLITAALVVVFPSAIQQAQAVKGEANEHISEQGRAHQSERGAERSGVVQQGGVVFCFEMTGGQGCFDSLGECDLARELLGSSEPVCTERLTSGLGDHLDCSIQSVEGEQDVVCTQIFN